VSSYRRATVRSVTKRAPGMSEVDLEFEDGATGPAVALEEMVGAIAEGNHVIANITAVELGLGSGGYHFVLWNLSRNSLDTGGEGHIMKLRYTPLQFNVKAAEEVLGDLDEDEDLSGVLGGMPVIAGSLHSQLLPVALAFRAAWPQGKLVYVMTDGGALPAVFSNTARFLRENGYLESVITCGNAFGGDLEAVGIHGALVVARCLARADAVVALMGPGIVGTGSNLGFSGMEQGIIINAAESLGGAPVAIARITFADARDRHRGLSHHTVSALKYGARAAATIALPLMQGARGDLAREQLAQAELGSAHEVREIDATGIGKLMEECELKGTVMGRGFDREPEFFMAAAAAGIIAARIGGGNGGV